MDRFGLGVRLTTLLLLLWLHTSVWAVATPAPPFPSNLRPSGTWTRPRFWVASNLSYYQSQWTNQTLRSSSEFKSETDKCINDGGHWRGPEACAYMCALAWRVSNVAAYGDCAVKFLGLADSAYVNVNRFGFNMAVAFDLVYDYSGFTNKAAIVTKIIGWSNTVWTDEEPGVPSAVDTDHNIGICASYLAQAIAVYGDAPSQDVINMLDRGWWYWIRGKGNDPVPGVYNSDAAIPYVEHLHRMGSGMPYIGWQYGFGTDLPFTWTAWHSLELLKYDLIGQNPFLADLWLRIVQAYVRILTPDRGHYLPFGDEENAVAVSASGYGIRSTLYTAAVFIEKYASLTSNASEANRWAAIARYVADAIAPSGPDQDSPQQFLMARESATKISPWDPASNVSPCIVGLNGVDFLSCRDDWSTSTTWVTFQADGMTPADHHNPDQGCLSLWYGGEYLTRNARTYDGYQFPQFNTIAIHTKDYRDGMPTWHSRYAPSFMARYATDVSGKMAYGMMNADQEWNEQDQWQSLKPVSSYRRHFLRIGDYVAVADRVEYVAGVSDWTEFRIRALKQPTLRGVQGWRSLGEVGNSRLIGRVMLPTSVSLTAFDETSWGTDTLLNYDGTSRSNNYDSSTVPEPQWQVRAKISTGTSHRYLVLMHMGTTAAADTVLDSAALTTGDGIGAKFGTYVINLANSETLRTAVSYGVPASASGNALQHFITDMSAACYSWTFGGETGIAYADSTSNMLRIATSSASSGTMAISSGTGCTVPPTTTPQLTTTAPGGTTTQPGGTTTQPGATTKPGSTTTQPAQTTTKPSSSSSGANRLLASVVATILIAAVLLFAM